MPKFKFPFQNVMAYRKTVENMAQRDFQEALASLTKQQQILQKMADDVTDARESRFQQEVEGSKPMLALGQVEDFIRGQDIRMEKQRAKIQEWENRVEELREILRLKAIDYKIIEGLRDRKKEQFDIEQRKREQKLLDEMNTMRFRAEGKK